MAVEFYYTMAGIAYAIFVIQFIISQFFGDLDIDIDADGDPDFDSGSLVSFKGLLHFCMGFFGWLSLKNYQNAFSKYDWLIAVGIGILFVIVLFYLYKLCIKFQNIPITKHGEELIGTEGLVNFVTEDGAVINIYNNGEYMSLQCYNAVTNNPPFTAGQKVTIVAYQNNKYYIV